MASVKHRIGVGKKGDDINNDFVLLPGDLWRFDSEIIKFDSTESTFDED